MSIRYVELKADPTDYIALRAAVGWSIMGQDMAKWALAGSLYGACAYEANQLVGMVRLVGDGASIWYIQDLVVLPDYQGRGVGTALMNLVMAYLKNQIPPSERMQVCLLAAKGKEGFYEKYGFRIRPNDTMGAGMHRWMVGE